MLEGVAGVQDVDVNLETGIATCKVDSSLETKALLSAVKKPYEAKLKP